MFLFVILCCYNLRLSLENVLCGVFFKFKCICISFFPVRLCLHRRTIIFFPKCFEWVFFLSPPDRNQPYLFSNFPLSTPSRWFQRMPTVEQLLSGNMFALPTLSHYLPSNTIRSKWCFSSTGWAMLITNEVVLSRGLQLAMTVPSSVCLINTSSHKYHRLSNLARAGERFSK